MPYRSRWTIPIPECSLTTFLFTSPGEDLGEQPSFLDADRADSHFLTRNSFRRWSQRLALGLTRSPHFKDGDRVLVFSSNTLFYPVAFMGIIMAGGVFSGANPSYTARELAYQWKDSGATYLFCIGSEIEIGIEAASIAGMDKDRIFVFDSDIYDGLKTSHSRQWRGCKYWGELFGSEEESKGFEWDDMRREGACHKTIALNYSSGTTGLPKGVEVTHKNYVANTIQANHLDSLRPGYDETADRKRALLFLPLYHAMGQTIFMAGCFTRKSPVYIMPKFDFIKMLEHVQRHRITGLSMVPPIAVALAKHPVVRQYDLSSVEAVGGGAAPLGRDIVQQVEKIWQGKINYKQGYGMTEVTCAILGWDPRLYSDSFSVGEPNANCEAKLMNPSTNGPSQFMEVTKRGPDHTGELWVKGPNVMKGYWRNPKATKETFSPDGEGWLRTGDVAYVDDKGMFYIVDRIKELIKVKGNQVAPAELEALLLEHFAVADVAVIGVQDEHGEELPRAYVVRQAGASDNISEKDIQEYVKNKVVRYKRLQGGVEWIDAIPKNPSGKILRKKLREEWKARQKSAKRATRGKL